MGRLFSADHLEHFENLGRLRPFEEWPGDYCYVGIDFEDPDFGMYLVDIRSRVVRIPLTFAEYVEHLLRWLGTGNWVQFVVDVEVVQGAVPVRVSIDRVALLLGAEG